MSEIKTLRIFISSPGDVYEERTLAQRAVDRMQSEYAGRVVLEPVFWEHEPLVATAGFQDQIAEPSTADIMISILWSRLGTRLPRNFTRADGTRYDSGTEYEFEEAVRGFEEHGKPHLLVYRKTATPSVSLEDEAALLERIEQKRKLDEFVNRWFHDTDEGTLKAAFHTFESPGEFEQALERHLHKMVDRLLPANDGEVAKTRAVWREGSPFRGLRTFDYEHAPIFFGRTRAIADVIDSLRDQATDGRPFVLILGMSGGGKSSLARAGVLPMLTRPGVIEGVGEWRRAVFRPSDVRGDLFRGLAASMLREPGLDVPGTDAEELADLLRESPRGALPLIRTALARHAEQAGANEARLALLLDQLEEIFTQDWVSDEDRTAFVDAIDVLVRSGLVWTVATVRSDLYPRCAKLPALVALKEGAGQYDILPPTATEIGQMIRLPTAAAGLRFEEDPGTGERLDDTLRDAAAARPELLALLQFTLQELYERRRDDGTLTLEAYRLLGGVEGSLARRAEMVFEKLPGPVQAALPEVLNNLVAIRRSSTETIGRKRAAMKEFQSGEALDLVEAFVEARLFVTELGDDDEPEVMVTHEALLWHWPRIIEWVDQNRENLRVHARLARSAERWLADNRNDDLLLPRGKPLEEANSLVDQNVPLTRDEETFVDASRARVARTKRMKAAMVSGLAVLAVVAAAAALFANQQRQVAVAERTRAETEAETATRTTDFMVDLFASSDPSQARGEELLAKDLLSAGAQRIDSELADQPEVQATLMDAIGQVYTSLGLYDEATPLLQGALEKLRAAQGDRSADVAKTMANLGETLSFQADYDTAEANFREAIALQTELLGADSPVVAGSMTGLAYVLTMKGEYEQAGSLLEGALDIRRESLGTEHADVAESLAGLGLNRFDQGQYDEAEALLRESLEMRRELFGSRPHPAVDQSLNNLALVLYYKGDYDQVEALERESLKMKRALYGESHPDVALGMNNLAGTLHDKGDYAAAESLYRDVLAMQRGMLDPTHPAVGQALNNLSILLYDMGRSEEATETLRESLDIYRAAFGDEHPEVARSTNNLAALLTEEGRATDAEPLARQALALRRALHDADHPEVASSEATLARALLDLERYTEARDLARHARDVFETAVGPDHWQTAAAASLEGAALTGLDQYAEAEQLLTRGYAALAADESVRPVRVRNAAEWLVELYESWGRPAEADRYRAELVALNEGG